MLSGVDEEYLEQFQKFKRALERNAGDPAPLPNRAQPTGKIQVLNSGIPEVRRDYDANAVGYYDRQLAANQLRREEGLNERDQASCINATPLTRPPTARVRHGSMG